MTSNQIQYWALQEQMRANRESERLKDFSNKEQARTNRRNEDIKESGIAAKTVSDTIGNILKLF